MLVVGLISLSLSLVLKLRLPSLLKLTVVNCCCCSFIRSVAWRCAIGDVSLGCCVSRAGEQLYLGSVDWPWWTVGR